MPPTSRGLGQLLVGLMGPRTMSYGVTAASAAATIAVRGISYTCASYQSTTTKSPHRWQTQYRCQYQCQEFSTSVRLQKKGSSNKKSKSKGGHAADKDSSSNSSFSSSSSTSTATAEDPFDHSTLQAAIEQAISRLKDNLARSRDAGRVSAPMIEALDVELGGSSNGKQKTRIGEIASVVPKGGRSMQVFCAEEGHVKAVMSALQASPYSLTPQMENSNTSADSANPLVITVPVPPVTAETRQQAAAEAKKAAEKAGLEVRNARGEAQKRFRKMELEKKVVVDELRKAHKGMEEVAKQGQEQVKAALDAALKALAR